MLTQHKPKNYHWTLHTSNSKGQQHILEILQQHILEDATLVVVPIPVDDDTDDIPLQAVGMPDEVMGEEEEEDEADDNEEEEDDDEEVDLCNVPRPLEVVVVLYLLPSMEVTVEVTRLRSASLRTRGASQGIIRKLPLGSKKRIHVHKKVFIEDETRSIIGAIFRANMDFPFVVWSSWKKYPERKEMLWQKFLRYFDFESPEQEAAGIVVFFHHISTNYTKWMEGARKFAISKVGEDAHPELWRNHPPEWICNDIWQKMVDVWASTKWQEKSRCAKTNRSVNDEPSHTGGSVPHAAIGVELKEKMPDISDAKLNLEVYKLTHKLKHDSNGQPLEEQDCPYVSKKAKAIRDAYAVRFDEISSQEPSSSLIDYDAVELW
ncbi:hypothetical protein RJ639_041117 [Escallonia herrerae]|uniref:Uncharacterized protein n=1 Tax=Escallonia herrerae TaxID=1293975 RepID=A0AA88WGA8_9ASTE|nr:hypothetical protein RJ639_041117 [Escallonia herrerae]